MAIARSGAVWVVACVGVAASLLLAGCCCPLFRTHSGGTGGSAGSGGMRGALASSTSREVAALWFQGGLGAPKGGSSKVTITVSPTASDVATVSFTETEVGGSGDTWRAAGWMSSCVSALTTGRPLNTYKVEYAVAGNIDGPSAGGLLSVAVLSALTGKQLAGDTTMTGTVNPDGTIGPVGGIAYKLDGARAAGKTKMLIPAGQRYQEDLTGNSPSQIDVFAKGKELGIDVVEVATVADAYRAFTGSDLTWASPPASAPKPDPDQYDRVTATARDWLARAEAEVDQITTLDPNIVQLLTSSNESTLSDLDRQYSRAQQYLLDNQPAAAYDAAFMAGITASGLYQAGKLVQDWLAAGATLDSIPPLVEAAAPEQAKVDAFIEDLSQRQPETVSDVLALADAYSTGMGAVGLIQFADQYQRAAEQATTQEEAGAALLGVAALYGLIEPALDCARDRLDLGFGLGGPAAPPDADVRSWAETIRHAVDANLSYFERTIVDEFAAQAGVNSAAVREQLMAADANYLMALGSRAALEGVKQALGEGKPETDRATLGIAMAGFALSSGLVAQYYSLGAQIDPQTGQSTVKSPKMLSNMLDEAENRAKAGLAEAQAVGVSLLLPYGYFECGKAYRETSGEDLETKLDALRCFWVSASYSRLAALLAKPSTPTHGK